MDKVAKRILLSSSHPYPHPHPHSQNCAPSAAFKTTNQRRLIPSKRIQRQQRLTAILHILFYTNRRQKRLNNCHQLNVRHFALNIQTNETSTYTCVGGNQTYHTSSRALPEQRVVVELLESVICSKSRRIYSRTRKFEK